MSRGPAPSRPGHHTLLPGQAPDGAPVLAVLLKRSYRLVPGDVAVRAEADEPLRPADEHWDAPENSSVRHESDFVPCKLATDVVFEARAHAPDGRAVAELEAAIQVADRVRRLAITGPRRVLSGPGGRPVFSDPQPFTSLSVVYERAYGGIDVRSDPERALPYPRNPAGCGFVVSDAPRAWHDLRLPNVEAVDDRLTPERLCLGDYGRWESAPVPAGWGWRGRTLWPRSSLAGVMPGDRSVERELRALYARFLRGTDREAYLRQTLPEMDFRFFSGASEGLSLPWLRGDEPVRTLHLSPEGRLDFRLPGERPEIGLDLGEGVQVPGTVLQTVFVAMENRRIDMVWRAAVPYPGPDWLPQARRLAVQVVEGGEITA